MKATLIILVLVKSSFALTCFEKGKCIASGKVLVSTGSPTGTSVKTEVIDLVDESTSCDGLEDYPIPVWGASGFLMNDSLPLICGGANDDLVPFSDCHIAGSATSDPVVKLLTARFDSAAVPINSHQLWVTGGWDGSNFLASTEIVDVLASPPTVVPGPELPVPMAAHCIVQLNESTVLFMGGRPNGKKTFFYDASTLTWTNGPDMNHERSVFGCGLMTMGSDILVVASGAYLSSSTTEVMSLGDPDGLKWSAGKNCSHITAFLM